MKPVFVNGSVFWILLIMFCRLSATAHQKGDPLVFPFDRHYGQVEVGGRYAGAEFHDSRPLPARISFYFPVANSIDLSTDYWQRGNSRPFAIGLRIANGKKQWIGREPWSYSLSPHRVTFHRTTGGLDYRIAYDFCLNEPALVQHITITNTTQRTIPIELYAHINAAIRTCQTYARKDTADIQYDPSLALFEADFPGTDAGRASVFVQDVGQPPEEYCADLPVLAVTDTGTSAWSDETISVPMSRDRFVTSSAKPIAASTYRKSLSSGDSLAIVRVIGSSPRGEVRERAQRLTSSWRNEIDAYSKFIDAYARKTAYMRTGDSMLDRSAVWARGLIAANQHYLDGTIVPMPCPAEYNFYFTHDLLLTNLGAVNFDPIRVKRDLLYVIAHAKDGIIPHAYYWRDTGFQTEYCDSTNWNHLWFIITTARYLRHTGDDSTALALYPFVTGSLRAILTQRRSDNLMYAYRPDWWDIGRREGPRSYITILTVRALRDYLYLSTRLHLNSGILPAYEERADAMQSALTARLWDDSLRYLINYNEDHKDRHYYMGSLLAPVYRVLDDSRSAELLTTASQQILRSPVGVMVVAPPDFHTDSMRAFFRFVGNEAGDPYVYANGGIWPHANASYALALMAVGKPDEALRFVKEAMTVDGVAASPNGLPAMYEYRYSDTASPDFGRIDKPSFLWAAGFYLNVLYALSGFQDNEWNLSLDGHRPHGMNSIDCSYAFGGLKNVELRGKSNRLREFVADGRPVASLVLPLSIAGANKLAVHFGESREPYLERLNAILHDVRYDRSDRILTINLESFEGHRTIASVVSPRPSRSITLNGIVVTDVQERTESDGERIYDIGFSGSADHQILEIHF